MMMHIPLEIDHQKKKKKTTLHEFSKQLNIDSSAPVQFFILTL